MVKKFLAKLLIYLSPLIVVLLVYVCTDPFRVLYHYDKFTADVDLNSDYLSTQRLMQHIDQFKYDSYIFGSSRSDNYMVGEWSRYINSTRCYHYDASWESLYGVEKKLQFLKRNKYPIRNALIIVDDELLEEVNNAKGHLRIKHPAISGQSWLGFQAEFLKDFFDKDFLFAYLRLMVHKWTGGNKPVAFGSAHGGFHYDSSSNEFVFTGIESQMAADSVGYYNSKKEILYERDTALHYWKSVLGKKQVHLLQNIRDILAENNTSYRIVISPLYNQLKMDTTDLNVLYTIFKKENVFDFSGINGYTQNKFNYYEASHFRIRVCTDILRSIYQ